MSLNLNDFILTNELPIRLGFFFGIFAVMALWEMLSPRRHLRASKAIRWINNPGMAFFNSFVLRLVFPAAAVGMAVFASEQGWGLFHYIAAPFWVAVCICWTTGLKWDVTVIRYQRVRSISRNCLANLSSADWK